MNTESRRSRTPYQGRFAALALAGAFAGAMFIPFGQGVAGASTGFPAVQAGGAPQPAPRVVPQAAPRVRVEKPLLRPHHHRSHRENVRIHVFNDNHNINREHRRHHHHHEPVRREEVNADTREDVKPDERDWWDDLIS